MQNAIIFLFNEALKLQLKFVRVSSAKIIVLYADSGQVVHHSRTKGETTSQATSRAFSQTTEGHRREQCFEKVVSRGELV